MEVPLCKNNKSRPIQEIDTIHLEINLGLVEGVNFVSIKTFSNCILFVGGDTEFHRDGNFTN